MWNAVATKQQKRRSGDAIRVLARDEKSYADILKEMTIRVDPSESGLEVLAIRRTRKEEVLIVLKKGGDVPTLKKAIDQAIEKKAQIQAVVTMRSLESTKQ